MPLPLIAVAGGFVGAISAGIVQFLLSRVGHFIAAIGITIVAYQGIDIAFSILYGYVNAESTALQSINLAVGNINYPIGSSFIGLLSRMGAFEALNVIVSAAISAFTLKQATFALKRTLGP